MNRRGFLARLIAVPVGLVAAAKGYASRSSTLVFPWFQNTRHASYASPAYLAALDKIMREPANGCTLTRMCEMRLTPADVESLGAEENRMAKYLEAFRRA